MKNNKVKKEIHKVAELGTMDVSIPVLELGEGKPRLTIVCGIHGDETTGIFAIDELLDKAQLKDRPIKGSIRIITAANPIAQALKRREGTDSKNLNRIFPGKADGFVSDRIAAKVLELVEDSDLVIDLHTFGMATALTAICVSNPDGHVKAFAPDIIWRIQLKRENKYGNALCLELKRRGINTFAVEFNNAQHNNAEDITRAADSLLNVARQMGIVDGRVELEEIPDATQLARHETTTDSAGLIIPRKKVLDQVKKGDVMLTLISLRDLSEKEIVAEHDGIVMQIRRREMVNTGDNIFAIGERID